MTAFSKKTIRICEIVEQQGIPQRQKAGITDFGLRAVWLPVPRSPGLAGQGERSRDTEVQAHQPAALPGELDFPSGGVCEIVAIVDKRRQSHIIRG